MKKHSILSEFFNFSGKLPGVKIFILLRCMNATFDEENKVEVIL